MTTTVRVLLVARYYIIEPLGILHLAGLASSLGCEVDVELVPENDFTGLMYKVKEWKPDFVGFQIWTGWHLQTFAACDEVRTLGTKVIIGGPHVTYFTEQCAKHADYVVRGDGFRMLQRILQGEVSPGVHFDPTQLAGGFPMPNRGVVYRKYPQLARSMIKSMIASVGCPYTCSYCYAPEWNEMYGGFKHTQRPVDDIIREAIELRDDYGVEMIYLQDDIFGFDLKWLADFSQRWAREVSVPFHCQIRLELTRNTSGERRLRLFKEAGCTGITLAIESGSDFLRTHVLNRKMEEELIVAGCALIRSLGMTLRTEQILGVPFSGLETDLSTLRLNCRINPEMAWTSILAPYEGTDMGRISFVFGFYQGGNDDLHETFFDRSVLRHVKTPLSVVEEVSTKLLLSEKDSGRPGAKPLHMMEGVKTGEHTVAVHLADSRDDFSKKHFLRQDTEPLFVLEFLDDEANRRYVDQLTVLQRLFMWLSSVRDGDVLARAFLAGDELSWGWGDLGACTEEHMRHLYSKEDLDTFSEKFLGEYGVASHGDLPQVVQLNPWYFMHFPSGAEFAKAVVANGLLHLGDSPAVMYDKLGWFARQWLFMRYLYKLIPSVPPVITRA